MIWFLIGGIVTSVFCVFSFIVFFCRASGNWFHGGYGFLYGKYGGFWGWLSGINVNGSWNDRIVPWLITFIISGIVSAVLFCLFFFL